MPHGAAGRERLAALKALHADVALCYDTGAYWKPLMLAIRAGIPNRVGYVHKGCSGGVTHPIGINFPQPYPAYFRDLVAQLTGMPPDGPLQPKVYPSQDDSREADALWRSFFLSGNQPVLAAFVASRQSIGVPPPRFLGEILASLSTRTPVNILLMGGTDDEALLHFLKHQWRLSAHIIAGRLNLRAVTALLARCTLVFSTDSGPRHLANAAGVPVAFVRNLWSRRIETGQYLDTETDLAPEVEMISPDSEKEWRQLIGVEQTASRLAHLLAHYQRTFRPSPAFWNQCQLRSASK